ncbi:MAG: D-alanyl-D-alanine carboxypeptidase [Acidimicrobiales bacterium]
MRRFLLPAAVLAVAVIASVLAGGANDAAAPDQASTGETVDSLATPLFSVRRAPEWLRQPTTDNLLDTAVRAPVEALAGTGFACLAVHVNGEPVTEVASDVPLIPGEVQRLLTLAALDTVGTGGFTTEVVRSSGAVITEEGVLEGDLWLLGGADPVLSTNPYISRFDDGRAFTSLEELALTTIVALRDAGITEIGGRIIGVDTKYEGSPQVFSDTYWTAAERRSGTVGLTSGLLVDNGFTSFPADAGDPSANVRSSDPVGHAASTFRDVLVALDMPVTGGAEAGDAPSAVDREPVARIESPALEEIAQRALADGTTAEMLWREAALRGGNPADGLGAIFFVNAAMVELGLLGSDEAGNFPKVDGSGLSLENRAQCGTLVGVLDPQTAGLAEAALPAVADSPLASCAPSSLASLRVTAAARPEVTSMAGIATAANGDLITFAVIADWLPDASGAFGPQAVCDGLLPAVLEAIAQHPAGPDLADLTPLDPVPAE